MTLSRCGRVYPTLADAVLAAQARTYKSGEPWRATSCAIAEHWHVVPKVAAAKLDPFPPVVALQLAARDPWCQRCGKDTGRLENHHRRAKQSGGSKGRQHTQCACNGLRLCRSCHAETHEHPVVARGNGRIVLQGVALPARIAVKRCIGADDEGNPVFDEQWPTCDGQWVHSPLETEQ